MSELSRLLVVGGVTAAGKTEAALALAEALDGELVGADSVQVYRGFDIGSAKPRPEDLRGVAHHLIDVVDPDAPFDAARYRTLADEAIASIRSRGRVPIVVGGTGLWIRSLVRGLVDLPAPDPALRRALEREITELGGESLHARLRELDPRAASKIHPNDARRVVRALEVHALTGRALGELHATHALGEPRYRARIYFLDLPREALYSRVDTRAAEMLARGWVEETRALHSRYGAVKPLGAVGYRQIVEHLSTPLEPSELLRRIGKATRVYTRRQRTFFGGLPDPLARTTASWLSSADGIADANDFLRR